MTIPVLDRLYVVSDLHLGGKTGFQIFNQGNRLANFIEALPNKSDELIGLVLNGDIVDFLAEEPASYLDPLGSTTKLKRITEDGAFSKVWAKLREFIQDKKANHRLILVLGNHDVELALPPVREWLLDYLSQGDEAARGRITLAFDGAGYACKVGDKRVLCLHGNEVDTWNIVNYRALLDVSRTLNRGAAPSDSDWDANAGTHMVIDVMNKVKKKFPMVDLLKPEIKAVAPVIVALDPSQLTAIGRLLRVGTYLNRDKVRRAIGFLSAETEAEAAEDQPTEAEVILQFLRENFGDTEYRRQEDVASLLMRSYENIAANRDPKDRLEAQDMEVLGVVDWAKEKLRLEERTEEVFRRALKKLLEEDRSFDVSHKDETFNELDKEIGMEVDYLIAGHTHLERAIERRHPGRYYFNSGTWIRLIQLSGEVLGNPAQFKRVFDAFNQRSMEQLDKVEDLGADGKHPLVLNKSTVVSVVHENGRTCGELSHAQDNGTLDPVEYTRLPRS